MEKRTKRITVESGVAYELSKPHRRVLNWLKKYGTGAIRFAQLVWKLTEFLRENTEQEEV